MSIRVGEVVAVQGTKVILRIDEESSKETLFHNGQAYKGISIREYVAIQRGFREIVCMVEGEYLDEGRIESHGRKPTYTRKVDVRPIGYFHDQAFKHGIKFLPMIKDPAFLLPETKVATIFGHQATGQEFIVGRLLKEDIPINLPWKDLFNGHIGIFGNTGSGKSNTLAKLYSVLFERKLPGIRGKSRFILLDFNGEYIGEQIAPADAKLVYLLSTRGTEPEVANTQTVFPLSADEFWELDTLSLLFQATQNTQRPFLNRVIEGRKRWVNTPGTLTAYLRRKFRDAFCAAEARPAALDLLRSVARLVDDQPLIDHLATVAYHGQQKRFYRGPLYYDTPAKYELELGPIVDQLDASNLDSFSELVLRAHLQLIGDLVNGYVQFEHIQPLLKRIESSLSSLRRVLVVRTDGDEQPPLTVISLRRCNNQMKKVLPLLLAKHYYNAHKNSVANPPDHTIHLIIDEAHNILSEQSNRETESWKDYRLEQFEEIVKEGRKFGVFVTIASQRPADISPTVVSQLHNFFIHRLINDRDLALIENTITTLDTVSRGLIPTLAQGCCVITGTAFDLPLLLQVDKLLPQKQPTSEDVDLEALWAT